MERGRIGRRGVLRMAAVALGAMIGRWGPAAREARAGSGATVVADALNLRAEPGTWAEVIATLGYGEWAEVIAGPTEDGWWELLSGERWGWASGEWLSFDGTGGEAVSFERWVDVNRSASQVTLFEGDSAVGMYWAATSEDTSDDGFYATAVGTWSVQEKVADLTWSEYAQAYIADWVGFDPDRENGFHSYSLDSYGNVLENGAAPTLGCVALSPEAADHLYQFVDIGTRVEIHW